LNETVHSPVKDYAKYFSAALSTLPFAALSVSNNDKNEKRK